MAEPAARVPEVDLEALGPDMADLVVKRQDDTGVPAIKMERGAVTRGVVDLIMTAVVSMIHLAGHTASEANGMLSRRLPKQRQSSGTRV